MEEASGSLLKRLGQGFSGSFLFLLCSSPLFAAPLCAAAVEKPSESLEPVADPISLRAGRGRNAGRTSC